LFDGLLGKIKLDRPEVPPSGRLLLEGLALNLWHPKDWDPWAIIKLFVKEMYIIY